ncbi:hypothetical protein HELRODRAFT_160284 [Helobdella robusta]|uniref:Uncharacterized protein n=1 Tax=Helobdella robusta TaxID=6412 RepID=T1EQ19_HELRO|nr:hypothetical protein HELRODRAFT_160284 [Helobdella robusta]ESO06138.1 hypothetical protein HELRODRAFT_160284 [Helobdella robusta]
MQTVVGCPEIQTPPNMWLEWEQGKVAAKCNSTSETWYMTCVDGRWFGYVGNCTAAPVVLKEELSKEEPYSTQGIVLAIVIGIILGIVTGMMLLFAVLCSRQRRKPMRKKRSNDSNKTTFLLKEQHSRGSNNTPINRYSICNHIIPCRSSSNVDSKNSTPGNNNCTADGYKKDLKKKKTLKTILLRSSSFKRVSSLFLQDVTSQEGLPVLYQDDGSCSNMYEMQPMKALSASQTSTPKMAVNLASNTTVCNVQEADLICKHLNYAQCQFCSEFCCSILADDNECCELELLLNEQQYQQQLPHCNQHQQHLNRTRPHKAKENESDMKQSNASQDVNTFLVITNSDASHGSAECHNKSFRQHHQQQQQQQPQQPQQLIHLQNFSSLHACTDLDMQQLHSEQHGKVKLTGSLSKKMSTIIANTNCPFQCHLEPAEACQCKNDCADNCLLCHDVNNRKIIDS